MLEKVSCLVPTKFPSPALSQPCHLRGVGGGLKTQAASENPASAFITKGTCKASVSQRRLRAQRGTVCQN